MRVKEDWMCWKRKPAKIGWGEGGVSGEYYTHETIKLKDKGLSRNV